MVKEKYHAYDVIKDILAIEGVARDEKYSYTELAEKLGQSRQALYGLLNPSNEMRVDRFNEMLDVLGYEIKTERKTPFTDEQVERLKKAGLL